MYISEQNAISQPLGVSSNTLKNHLHCLSVLRNKCAHGARLYNATFSPPAHLGETFLRKNPSVANDSFFAFLMVLLRHLPTKGQKDSLGRDFVNLLHSYEADIDLNLLGIPPNYLDLLKVKPYVMT